MLEDLVKRAAGELRLRERAIDEVMDRARRARVLSKQSIQQVHGGAMDGANARLQEAGRLLLEIEEIVAERPGLGCFDQVGAAREEYAEARILLELESSGDYPDPETVGVPLESYLMGLGDVPGELRRRALDALRVGDLERAESLLGTMEEIYLSLISMEESTLLRGLRRKIDIARGVTERTRSEITAEAGRRRLDESVRRLADRLE
jgi:translin